MAALRLCTVFVLLVAVVIAACHAQLTFTPAWGKRSGANINGQLNALGVDGGLNGAVGSGGSSAFGDSGATKQCQPSADSLLLIHHIIQLEAQKLIECRSKDVSGF